MSGIEWWTPDLSPEPVVVSAAPEAAVTTVGPDEILVVVFPRWVGEHLLAQHSARLREALGDRFILVSGDDVMLAKVKSSDWARPALDKE